MASAGAQCEHVNHVSSQLPYVINVVAVVFLTYIVAGLTQGLGIFASGAISWVVGLVLLVVSLILWKKRSIAKSK